MPTTSILLVDPDRSSAEAIANVLRPLGHEVALVHDFKKTESRVPGRQIVIISGGTKQNRAIELARRIRAGTGASATPAASVPILAIVPQDAAEQRVRWFDAGADDVLVRPFDPRELEARVDALAVRYERAREIAASSTAGRRRRVISFVGAKGGIGTTTVAVNLARALIDAKPMKAAIIDADLQRGQVATQLNLTPNQGLIDAAQDPQAADDGDSLEQYVTRHTSGLAVLAAPAVPESDAALAPDVFKRIVGTLAERYDVVFIDAGARVDDRTVAAVENSDDLIFVLAPDIASLRAMKAVVMALGTSGAAVSRTRFVLNHVYARELLRRQEIESVLGARIGFELPYDDMLYQQAVNQGVPLVRGAPESAAADAYRRFAAVVLGQEPQAEGNGRTAEKKRRLTGVLRR